MQQHLELIPHNAEGSIIYQRPSDGYINATAMCQAAGRPWGRYWDTTQAKEFAKELSSEIGIPITELIQSVRGGEPSHQGTWVHPQVAINLAQWLSSKFAVRVSKWVADWMSGNTVPAKAEMPYHLRRYVANQQNLPADHFSILKEMTLALIAPMEAMGYTLPENMMPDISHGRMFCKWLRDQGVDTDALPKYWHIFEDGRRVQAKAYPESLLIAWRKHFREEWLPHKAIPYFTGKDNAALAYLPQLLSSPKAA